MFKDSMIGKISTLLTEQYGYEFSSFVSHPLKDKYDSIYHSGHITVLLTDDINAEEIHVVVMDDVNGSETRIPYNSNQYEALLLGLLAGFAARRHKSS